MALYKIVRVRHRYLFTKNNKLRLRYFVGTLAIVSMTMTSFLGAMTSSIAHSSYQVDIAADPVRVDDVNVAEDDAVQPVLETVVALGQEADIADAVDALNDVPADDIQIIGVEGVQDDGNPLDVALAEQSDENAEAQLPREELLKIGTGDTIAGALQDAGVSGAEAYKAVKALTKYYDPRNIKPGQAISVTLEPNEDEGLSLGLMNLKLSATEEVIVSRDESGRYSAEKDKKEVFREMVAAKASIETSLYGSAARAGIPASVVANMIRIFSYEVDFQRDIRQGDQVKILYETYQTEDGDFARYGNILYASLMVGGREIPVYRFEEKDDNHAYYKGNGDSLKRTLMSTPIDGARMSSGFGMRRHPVLGYNKMHKGVDFAAPRGTPIYAAGDGVIEKAGRLGGYGKYIRIRHNGSLKTAYAHMKGYAKGMKPGKRVKQGDVIGYVGTTGRSTGPHLHFEVLRNGKQVNPKSIKSSAGKKLAGSRLEQFKKQVSEIDGQYASLSKGLEFASNEISE